MNCLNCDEPLTNKYGIKFCSRSCAASYSNRGKPSKNRRYTEEQKLEIIKLFNDGYNIEFLSKKFCLGKASIRSAIKGFVNRNKINKTFICKICNKELIYKSKASGSLKRTICSACLVSRRRKQLKILAIEYKGGKCFVCGYNKCNDALEFHHLNPKDKEFGIASNGLTRSFEKIIPELDKCVLVCANCHREIEAGLVKIDIAR